MKKIWILLAAAVLPVWFSGCGLSIYEDWKQSGGKAITGAGAIAGKDYITGLKPSENSRKYFARISGNDQPIETVSRSDDGESKSGVKFVKGGGILIPPGVTISFENKGYCMDPHLPAPKAEEEYQLIPMTQLIPENLQGIYKNLVTKAAAGDESIQRNMQHLVWALRTAGTDAAYANNLTKEQKKILDRCSEYPGQFEEFNATAKANSKALKELVGLADSFLNVRIGGVSYKASDLLDPDIGNKKINEHINQLIGMSKNLPVEKTGFNFGEIQPGIYTDVRGTGPLQYRAKIANSTNQSFIYYPTEYVGQVGSPTKNGGMATYATADTTMRQRVTGGNPDKADVVDQRKECPPHSWVAVRNNGVQSEPFDSQREKLREKYKKELDKADRIAAKKLYDDYHKNPDGAERGVHIWLDPETGEVEVGEVYAGARDYFIDEVRMSIPIPGEKEIKIWKKNVGRVREFSERDSSGNVISHKYEAVDPDTGDVIKDNCGPLGIYPNNGQYKIREIAGLASVNYDKSKIPPGKIPLRFSHLHVQEDGEDVKFSDTDIFSVAQGNNIDISVVSSSDVNDSNHYSIDSGRIYDQQGNDITKKNSSLLKSAKKNVTIKCTRCGATK